MTKIDKLCAIYTKDLAPLKDLFVNSIKDEWSLEIDEIQPIIDGEYFYRSDRFISTIRSKMYWTIKKLKENYGKIIIISDIDILFYKSCNDILLNLIVDNDILFQQDLPNTRNINSGFMVIKCNDNTINFFNKVIEYDPKNFHNSEQSIIQNCLNDNVMDELKWNLLPHSFYADSLNYNAHTWTFLDDMPFIKPNELYLHHANGTCFGLSGYTVLEFKLKRLKDMTLLY